MIQEKDINESLIGKIVLYDSHYNKMEIGKVTSIGDSDHIRCLFRLKIEIARAEYPDEMVFSLRCGDTSESCSKNDLTILDFQREDKR